MFNVADKIEKKKENMTYNKVTHYIVLHKRPEPPLLLSEYASKDQNFVTF